MIAYHVVTERPMYVGQQITFDEKHHMKCYTNVVTGVANKI